MKIDNPQNWSDEKGNQLTFLGQTEMRRSQIEFLDKKSIVTIGDNCELRDAKITVGTGSSVTIGEGSIVDGMIFVGAYSKVTIGRKLSVTHHATLRAVENTQITLGDDCLLASNVCIRTNDGHPIYCTQTGERLNPPANVSIGDHVWLGDGALILKGVVIAEGSIVGAASVVTKSVERAALVAGVPAKVVRPNVTWEHSNRQRTEALYDFTSIRGIKLSTPAAIMTDTIRQTIGNGSYESMEARQLPRILKEGDRLLEFGGGLGFISAYCQSLVRLDGCTVVEANPKLIPVIQQTHSLNGSHADLRHAVALSKESPLWAHVSADGRIPFYISKNFWGSSLSQSEQTIETVEVDVLKVEDLVSEVKPTIVICDIEGGEIDLLDHADLQSVRHIVMEVHKGVIGIKGVNAISETLSKNDFYYDPDYSMGQVVVYSKG